MLMKMHEYLTNKFDCDVDISVINFDKKVCRFDTIEKPRKHGVLVYDDESAEYKLELCASKIYSIMRFAENIDVN